MAPATVALETTASAAVQLETCAPPGANIAADAGAAEGELQHYGILDEPTDVSLLRKRELHEFFVYVDLNCPFCFALHERLARWQLLDSLSFRMVEHASHVIDGPFNIDEEVMLANEVFAVHHRAPDVQVLLPPRRYSSKLANRLIYAVQQDHAPKAAAFRTALYRCLWRNGEDIGDEGVLRAALTEQELPDSLLASCTHDPVELIDWQHHWEQAKFDSCIPILHHEASDRVLVGLPTERALVEFLLGERSRVVSSSVCYYQRRPVVLICGRMQSLWPLIQDLRDSCDVVQAQNAEQAATTLSQQAAPDLVLIEVRDDDAAVATAVATAKARSIPWIIVTHEASHEGEVAALSEGAAEYLSLQDHLELARMRLGRIVRDRLSVERRHEEAMTDPLTGLASRRKLTAQIESEWQRATREGATLALIMFDIDRFKSFNDTHGYLAGDQCLAQIAARWDAEVRRPRDLLARFGGNEFVVLLPETDLPTAEALAQRLKSSVAEANITHSGSPADGMLTVSAGVACCTPNEELTPDALVDAVDEARREAQRRGGNQVCADVAVAIREAATTLRH